MAAKKAPAKKMAAPKPAPKKTGSAAQFRMKEEADKKKAKAASTPRSNTFGKGRRDVYGQSGFGETESNIDNKYGANVEAVGRSALKAISGKKPRKNEPLHGSETQIARSQALKGLGLSGAQIRYVEDMMSKVPYRPKRRSR